MLNEICRDIIIFDLDGTLADVEHRLHYINSDGIYDAPKGEMKPKPDWPAFFAACDKDKPIHEVIEVMLALHSVGFLIWITSGRSDEVRDKTLSWLFKHAIVPENLLMRKAGDHQADETLKQSWITDKTIPLERVMCVFEDRQKAVDMWRRNGLRVMQVADGKF